MLKDKIARAPANVSVPLVDSYDLAQAELERIRSLLNRFSAKKMNLVSAVMFIQF